MRLTAFGHAGLLIVGGMFLSLIVGRWGPDAYGVVVIAVLLIVLVREWSVPRVDYRRDEMGDD